MLIFNQEYENKELKFPLSFRPARRYLYFRFIITYLHAKSAGNKEFTDSVEFKRSFWASGGQWLNGSTLMSLARNISGMELPDCIKENAFFDPEISADEAELSSEISAGKIRQTAVESMKVQEDAGREKEVVGDMGTLSML